MTVRTSLFALALASLLFVGAAADAATATRPEAPKPGLKPVPPPRELPFDTPRDGAAKDGAAKDGARVESGKPGAAAPSAAAPPAAGQAATPAVASPSVPAAAASPPAGEWVISPTMNGEGKLSYCVAEAVYDSGHTLMIARNAKGELNVGLQIPGASLPRGQDWPVKVTIDDKLARERVAVATQSDMLVVPHGADEELFTALMNGRELAVVSDSDRVAFLLKGTRKALLDLKACVDKGGNIPLPKKAVEKPADSRPGALPDELLQLLAAAGIRGVEPVSLDNVAIDKRPADYVWRAGPVTGSVRQHTVPDDATLAEISSIYQRAMDKACTGKADLTYKDAEALPGVMLRTGAVDCTTDRGTVHAALLLYLTDAKLFTLFSHEVETRDADRSQADRMRDRIAEVIRELAYKGTIGGKPKAG